MKFGRSIRLALAIQVAVLLVACAPAGVVTKPDPATGKLATSSHPSKTRILVDERFDVSKAKGLAIVTAGNFATDQIRALGLFDSVMSLEDAERMALDTGLSDEVGSLRDMIGQYRLAKRYKPFLLFSAHHESRKNPHALAWIVSDETEYFLQLNVTDPMTAKVVFSAEIEEDYRWKGVTDQNTYYPLMNLYVDWHKRQLALSSPPATP